VPPNPAEPFVIAPGGGLAVANPVGGVTTFKAMAESSGGAFTALEGVSAPGEGPPLHVHREQDELIYTLDGRLRIRLGDESFDVEPGAFVFIPRGTPHTWQNIGDGAARFLAVVAPSIRPFERFFERYAALPDHERDGAAFARLAAETQGMEVVGPPLSRS
jgi:quercetin dioxygenase-like cupin family protein